MQRGRIPDRARLRRQNRPASVRKAADEERRRFLDDMVRGLEPSDEGAGLDALHFAKAHVGVHLVNVALD
jgi:hypothetical protein